MTGRTKKCCVGYQEHQNRTAVARFSLFGPILSFPRSKAILTFRGLIWATLVRFWCSWCLAQHFWVRPVILDRFQGPGRSFRGEKWGWKSKNGRFFLFSCDNRAPEWKTFWPHFSPLNDLPGPWNPYRSTGRTQKSCVGYQEHQNRTAVARFSPFGPILSFPRSKAILTFQGLIWATLVRFWCSWCLAQHFSVLPVNQDGFQGACFKNLKNGWF